MEINNTINERNWELLISAVRDGRVIPVLGDNLVRIVDKEKEYDANTYIIEKLCDNLNVPIDSRDDIDFSAIDDFINISNRRRVDFGNSTDIYYEIFKILQNVKVILPPFVLEMLNKCSFPLVLTTSFALTLGDNIVWNEISYRKHASGDIKTTDLSNKTPTLYYLFGKASRLNKSYVVTDDDLLDFLHAWHNIDTRPEHLGDYLSGKYLLVLGCKYPNWLFRFFWHSIKNFNIIPETPDLQGVVSIENTVDKDLIRFLSRIQTSVFSNAESFIQLFLEKFNSTTCDTDVENNKIAKQIDNDVLPDFFISYANEDKMVVKEIVEILESVGARVWFDEKRLEMADTYEEVINLKIESSKIFVPIISKETLQPGRRFFKKEWKKAIVESEYRYGERFLAPIIIDDTDANDTRIPREFRDAHQLKYPQPDFKEKIVSLLRSIR